MYDVVVIGGSYAGISAAMQLARGRQKVLVADTGKRRNRFASNAHGFLGRDGFAPGAIAEEAKEQLLRYPNVEWLEDEAMTAEGSIDAFTVSTKDQRKIEARRLILATGVTDGLPAIPGLAERWGRSVFHCPYCHGYELDNGNLGVLAVGEASMHQALLIPDWGNTTFFINNAFSPSGEQLMQLAARNVKIELAGVKEISGGGAGVLLDDGRLIELDGLFVASRTEPSSPLAGQLGCELSEGPLGHFIKTGETKETTVEGVFACGDAARAAGNIAFAVADGTMAGSGAHRSLIFSVLG